MSETPTIASASFLYFLKRQLQLTQEELDSLILATPTSELRNRLTEANILLLESIRRLEIAFATQD